jgi:hypothetical protein
VDFMPSLAAVVNISATGQDGLADIITKIVNGHPNSQIDELLPWAYPAVPALREVA